MSKPSDAVTAAALSLGLDEGFLVGVLAALRLANEGYLDLKKQDNGSWHYLYSVSVEPVYPNQPNSDGSYNV